MMENDDLRSCQKFTSRRLRAWSLAPALRVPLARGAPRGSNFGVASVLVVIVRGNQNRLARNRGGGAAAFLGISRKRRVTFIVLQRQWVNSCVHDGGSNYTYGRCQITQGDDVALALELETLMHGLVNVCNMGSEVSWHGAPCTQHSRLCL